MTEKQPNDDIRAILKDIILVQREHEAKVFQRIDGIIEALNIQGEVLRQHEKILSKHAKILSKHAKIFSQHEALLLKHDRIIAEEEKILQEWRRQFGDYTDTESKCLEDEFGDALRMAKKRGTFKLEEVHVRQQSLRKPGKLGGEYDLVAVNGNAVLVGEIKHRLTADKVQNFSKKKLSRYAKDFPPTARGRKVVGMVGGAYIEKNAEETARAMGMYVLRLNNNRELKVLSPNK